MLVEKMTLGKWPAMVVVGKPVTEEQAKEIIVRTSGISFYSNNHEFVQMLYEHIFDKKLNVKKYHSSICDYYTNEEEYQRVIKKYGILYCLDYLINSQIVSSYIGGPHGWCNWDGTIFTNSYNIGKYPSVDDVLKEWKVIAKTFPYLDIKCQLWSGECGEDNTVPAVQYNVKNGNVTMVEPEDIYVYPGCGGSGNLNRFAQRLAFGSSMECGCTITDALDAFDYVENLMREV
jgi:hypothetical protein